MDSISVGDYAEQLMREQTDPTVTTASPPVAAPIPLGDPSYIEEDSVDISQIKVPINFLEAVNENKEVVLPTPTVVEDKAEVAEDNPVAGQAIDIIIEGLGKMLDAVKETLNEVKEFVNEHSLVTELTTVGDVGVNMAPTKNNKKKVAVEDEEDDGKEDRIKTILAKIKRKKGAAK